MVQHEVRVPDPPSVRIDVTGTSGYVRKQVGGLWAWKCQACSTADYPFDDQDEATERLRDHNDDCFETRPIRP